MFKLDYNSTIFINNKLPRYKLIIYMNQYCTYSSKNRSTINVMKVYVRYKLNLTYINLQKLFISVHEKQQKILNQVYTRLR